MTADDRPEDGGRDRRRRRRAAAALAAPRRPEHGRTPRTAHARAYAERAMSAEPFSEPYEARRGPSHTTEIVAGYLAAFAIFASVIALAWHPLRLLGPSLLIALIAAGMAGRGKRLQLAAVLISAALLLPRA